MKLIHLSDLHIGKRVYEFSMLEDQKYILEQILSVVARERPDGVILAGDIYDKPIPSAEAVQVFDMFLTKLSEKHCPVFAVSGNHDSAERIAFGSSLMRGQEIYLSPVYDGTASSVIYSDEYGEVEIFLLPFLKPAVMRRVLELRGENEKAENIRTCQDAVQEAIARMNPDPTRRNILVSHQFVTGALRCESEEVVVGGLDQIDVSVFDDFDYVALGHLHSPQHVGRETVRYSGTPLKYSFSEALQEKSLTVVELGDKCGEKTDLQIRTIPLKPFRDMRKIRGTYLEVTARDFYQGTRTEDYIHVTLTDEEDIPDGLQKLRVIYPNLMRLEYDNRRTRENRLVDGADITKEKSELELFAEFYELQNNQEMSPVQEHFVKRLIQDIQEKMK